MYKIEGFTANGGNDSTQSSGINASGGICGGAFTATGLRGADWKSYAPASPVLSVPNSYFYGINAGGDAVGATGMNNTPTERACLFRNGQLIDLFGVVGEYSLATEINNAGRITGWTHRNGKSNGFVYESAGGGGAVTFLDPFDGDESCGAFAVNQSGDVAGKSGNSRAFLLADGDITEVGNASWVAGINANRQIVGSEGAAAPGNWRAVVIDASTGGPTTTQVPLPPGAVGSHGQAINDHGTVVGSAWTADTYNSHNQYAFVSSGGDSTDLNTLIPAGTGWHLFFAQGINNNGQIVCDGTYNGENATAVLTPEDKYGFRRFDALLMITIFGGVAQDGGGFGIKPGGGPVPIDPWGPLREVGAQLTPERRDLLIALASEIMASNVGAKDIRDRLRTAAVDAARTSLDALLHAAPTPGTVRSQLNSRASTGSGRRMKDGRAVIN